MNHTSAAFSTNFTKLHCSEEKTVFNFQRVNNTSDLVEGEGNVSLIEEVLVHS
jgi:hypothetical protein